MQEKTLRWGVLGCANIAVRAVIPGIQQSATGAVVAIASRDAAKAAATAQALNIAKSYDSYEALLSDPDVDAVYIPLPNHLHKDWTMQAAAAGKHVLCEKPLALTAAEAKQMVAACATAGVQLAEAFMYRHHPRYERIKQLMRAGEIGDVRGIHSTFTFNNAADKNNIRYRRAMGGGSIYDVGCYPLSAARFLLEREPVAATVQAFFSPEHDGVDMMASGLVEFPGDVGLTFDCGMWAAGRNTLEVLGTQGRIEVPFAFLGDPNFFVVVQGERREERCDSLNPYTLQADSFARSVWQQIPIRFAPQDAVNNMRLLDACLQSARERTRVQI